MERSISDNKNCPFIQNGLAMYTRGKGKLLFLMPYPHASSYRSMSESRLAELLVKNNYKIITFDPPGFMRSTRKALCTIDEMYSCTIECLDYFKIDQAVTFLGHSMSSFCCLGFAVNYPSKISSLILSSSIFNYTSLKQNAIHKQLHIYQKDWWLLRYYGIRILGNFANLAIHKKLDNINSYHSFYNKKYWKKEIISFSDKRLPLPQRSRWINIIRKNVFTEKLIDINVPVLLISGKHDKLTSPYMAEKLQKLLRSSELKVFKKSGHSPFIEESELFIDSLNVFLKNISFES